MKPVFSLEEIRAAIDQVTIGDYPKKAYNAFVDALMARLQGPVPVEFDPDNIDLQLMRDAANVVFHKMEAEKLLAIMRERNPIKEVPTRSSRSGFASCLRGRRVATRRIREAAPTKIASGQNSAGASTG